MSGLSCKRRLFRRLRSDRRGVAFLEFALTLPMFLGFVAAGLEFSHLMMTNMRVQRLATMTADMIAQRGASDKQISEMQIYDIMFALDVAAQPLKMREHGRIIISAVLGEDTNNDRVADYNRIKWQRYDGGFTTATNIIGCRQNNDRAVLKDSRSLVLNEAFFMAQVSYEYDPLFGESLVRWFGVPEVITRTAAYRGRGSVFKPVLTTPGYAPKENCTSPSGL
ncbi:hypothetical protein GGR88_000935 [Sphingomonas jejuensis]|jgi:hypothetical protein|uniref:TadE-like domain-containing protein n=1 Tax=Sphingomonas jejuensis TaxID=904715 RepID=A0ABX0XJF1_9SPHN|nr:TadE/TadG family type IV pilus assembly protein [Sphingomonas jejuensis]NJC33461.1 hypothetical protein [Sphingomonas jejuensis]